MGRGHGHGQAEIDEAAVGADGALYKRGRRRAQCDPTDSDSGAKAAAPAGAVASLPVFEIEVTNLTSLGNSIARDGGYRLPLVLEVDTIASSPRAPTRPVWVSNLNDVDVGIIPIATAGPIVQLITSGHRLDARRSPRSAGGALWLRIAACR